MFDPILKILMIEDNPVDVFLMKSLLTKIPQVETHLIYESSLSASIAQIQAQKFDIILLDLSLTDSWGLDSLYKIRAVDAQIPIIIITAHEDEEWAIDALKNGAQDYIVKNQLTSTSLKRTIRFAIERENYYANIRNKAIELETLNQENQRTAKKFEMIAYELLRRLSKVSQARDHITGSHTERVGGMAMIVALGLGFTKEDSLILRQTAPLHDLGKVGIPDRILLKPGTLNPDEWETMKAHTTMGYALLKESIHPIIQKASIIALTHHEKWNGNGYPDQLSGTEIPIEGRIVGLVDVFDALTSNRPYKKAWSVPRALEYIQEQADISFDPEIVEVFLRKKEEIFEIKESEEPDKDEDDFTIL